MERHKKIIQLKASLVLIASLIAWFSLILALGPLLEKFAGFLAGLPAYTVAFIAATLTFYVVYSIPVLYVREFYEYERQKAPEEIKEEKITEEPIIKFLKELEWEVEDFSENSITFTNYATSLHRFIGKKSVLKLEKTGEGDNCKVFESYRNGERWQKFKVSYEASETGSNVLEEAVSTRRASTLVLELSMIQMPEIQKIAPKTFKEDLDLKDLEIGFSLRKPEFKKLSGNIETGI